MVRQQHISINTSTSPDMDSDQPPRSGDAEVNQSVIKEETLISEAPKEPQAAPPSEHSLDQALEALDIQADASKRMFRALASIIQASQMQDGNINLNRSDGGDIWAILRNADILETQGGRDVLALGALKLVLVQMLLSSSQLLLPAMRILADSSRDSSWRIPLGESGILDFCLTIMISPMVSSDLETQALRLIGNSCADTNENRNRVLSGGYLLAIMSKMHDPQLASFAVPVFYNICCEYEPAQKEAIQGGLYIALMQVLSSGNLDSSPSLSYLCRLLDLGQESLDPSQSAEDTVEISLRTATQPDLDVEDCASLVDFAVAHLQWEQFQKHMVNQELFGIPLRFLVRSYFPQANFSGSKVPSLNPASTASREPGEEAELSRIRKSLIQALSDVSATPEFLAKHESLASPLIDSLRMWLPAALPQLQLCSCIVLGNLARSDEICVAMVSRLGIQRELLQVIRTSSDSTVTHSALGFLRNLALPKSNKESLGDAGAVEALTRFWTSDALPQVSYAAVSVGRQLVNGTVSNVQRLLTPLSNDSESPASSRTYLSLLLSLFDKTDETATKTEIARMVAATLRCIHSLSTPLSQTMKNDILHRLFSLHSNLVVPLGTMVSQSRYPVIRSEGWFALALVARSPEGCAAIVNKAIADVQVYTALEDAIRPPSAVTASGSQQENSSSVGSTPITDPATPISPTQGQISGQGPDQISQNGIGDRGSSVGQDVKSKDRENAMILVNQLLQYNGEDMLADIRRSALEDLLHKGSSFIGSSSSS